MFKRPSVNLIGEGVLSPLENSQTIEITMIAKCFEELEVWQKARELTKVIYKASSNGDFMKDYGLRNQMCRAAVSTMANIAEGFERGGNKEFLQFLSQAKGSCGELRSQLYVALDQEYLSRSEFDSMFESARLITRMISSLMQYMQSSGLKGSKYRSIQ